ncbi:MAG: 2-amino-4-hydroxy-6-hydroxymethyldihydropteridine diphosphokinase [Burkholderiaceae bacterium]|nr:2-amino-4-hydroxy-6-hydroxymethyldihydropteridine diphosphokinase [Burkholderiaceae bacterium]
MTIAYVALGANLGDPLKALPDVIDVIGAVEGIKVTGRSRFYSTAPIDSSGPDYTNAVIRIETTIEPEALLQTLLAIEKDFGRQRPVGIHNAPRTMDLDLLLYGDVEMASQTLILPHPRMHERAFVLVPLADIDETVEIARKGRVKDLLPTVADQMIRPLA